MRGKAMTMRTSVLLVMAASMLVAATGFLREVVGAYLFGTSAAADAFSLVLVYIEGLYVVISVGLASYMLVPLVVKLDAAGGTGHGERLTETLQLWASLLFVPVAMVAWLAPGATARAMAPGFSDLQHHVLANMLPEAAACALLLIIGGFFSGVLQARDAYLGPVLGRGAFNVGVVTMLVAGSGDSATAAAHGLLVGGLLQLLLQIAVLWRSGWRPARPRLTHVHLGSAVAAGLPGVVALFVVNVLAVAIQRAIGSNLDEGSLAAVNYAQRTLSVASFLSLSISTVSLTRLSSAVTEDTTGGMARGTVERHLSAMAWLMAPLSIWLALVAPALTAALFQRGAYTPESARLTAECLRWFAASLVPAGLLQILNRAGSAWNWNWSIALSSTLLAAVTIIATLWFLPLGAKALAIALFCGSVAGLVAQAWLMRNVLGTQVLVRTMSATGISALRAALAILPLIGWRDWFLTPDALFFIVLRLVGGLIVFGVLYVGMGLITRDRLTRQVLWGPAKAIPGAYNEGHDMRSR
jgi:putative peptidoglycan lipid II flippase